VLREILNSFIDSEELIIHIIYISPQKKARLTIT